MAVVSDHSSSTQKGDRRGDTLGEQQPTGPAEEFAVGPTSYALSVANGSYEWYKSHARLARRAYKLAEITVITVSAAIPVTLAIAPGQTAVASIMGAVIVVVSGLRSVYHWQDDYLRFSQAREAVELERRRYRLASGRYADPRRRDIALVEAVSRIEQDEMRQWVQVASSSPETAPNEPATSIPRARRKPPRGSAYSPPISAAAPARGDSP